MLLQIVNASVSFGGESVLSHVNFEVKNKNDKIAVIGRNGAGKTTMLRLITKDVEPDHIDGEEAMVIQPAGVSVGYLKQISFDDLSVTLDDEIRKVFVRILTMKAELDSYVERMSDTTLSPSESERLASEYTALQEEFQDLGGYYYEKEYDTVLKSFGFDMADKQKKLSEFSGGQLTKLAFIKLLLSKPDVLLLDEPTNHLDITTIAWLEQYLRDYKKAVVVISHDRMFIDRIANSVYEITYGEVLYYPGNYSDYVRIKKERYEKQMKDHIAQQKEIARLMEIVERFKNKPTKVAMTRSKLKAIEHMEKVAMPAEYETKSFKVNYTPTLTTGKDVLFLQDLSIGYTKELSRVNLDLKRGERLGIIGGNGIGKSTLLKTLTDRLPALSGYMRWGVNVQIGYFDQQMAQYSSDKKVIDDFWDMYPHMTQTEVRNALGALLFSGDDVFKDVSMLSGGERVRLALAKMLQEKPNVLILDEPTNHMDMVGKETLENMLIGFDGTVIFVSHDRYFVRKVATQVLAMDETGCVLYPFGYDDYEEKTGQGGYVRTVGKSSEAGTKSSVKEANPSPQDTDVRPTVDAKSSYEAGKEAARRKKRLEKLEELIEQAEVEMQAKKDEIMNPENASDYVKLQSLQDEADLLEEKILEYMEEWDSINSEIENQGE